MLVNSVVLSKGLILLIKLLISINSFISLGLRELSKTDRGKQIFKELSDEEKRHMLIFKDHLELEELF